jgi:putative ABC transport system substrate-binding protein
LAQDQPRLTLAPVTCCSEVLRDNGFAVNLESRFAEGKLERLPELAAELVRLKPHLIVVADAVSTSILKKATSTIPIIMAGASDRGRLGSRAEPCAAGRKCHGFSSPYGDEFTTKWVELLKGDTSRCSPPGGALESGDPSRSPPQ